MEEERAAVWPPAGARPREDGPPATDPVRAAVLSAQRTVGNREVARTVQRLVDATGRKKAIKSCDDRFLLNMLHVSKRAPGKFTVMGAVWTVEAPDIPAAEKELWRRQAEMFRASGKVSPYTSYEDYLKARGDHAGKYLERAEAGVAAGQVLYHGTTPEAAAAIKGTGLTPAKPAFRGGMWDASRDGFLSLAKLPKGVTIKAGGIVLRVTLVEDDLVKDRWKKAGGADEVVTTITIPVDRLEWIVARPGWGLAKDGEWSAMSAFKGGKK
ncbi:hypothetical protein Afil01_64540 [Actinorhabdospora filicis]|uniref:Uncharacterized protein n=1 Tax=Actinorhabdospora filicis TaxID=1785913 RepID=A0A9W6STP5_9ACTN|nr:hypothetical protein Afil01_64540 [Actinorhabdospora filicis]